MNGIFIGEKTMGQIQEIYPENFQSYKSRYTQTFVKYLQNPIEQEETILHEHRRAHRSYKENKQQILKQYFFPEMEKKLKKLQTNVKYAKSINMIGNPRSPQ